MTALDKLRMVVNVRCDDRALALEIWQLAQDAVREERSACARIADDECEAIAPDTPHIGSGHWVAARIAAQIRARINPLT